MISHACTITMVFKHLIHACYEGPLSCFYVGCGISAAIAVLGFLGRGLGLLLLDRGGLCCR